VGCEKLVANFMSFVKLVTINRHSDLKNQSAMDTAVVYLARRKEGLEPLRRFVDTYGKTAAGVQHDLIVIYKGFEWSLRAPRIGVDQYLARRHARSVLRPIERGSVTVTDEMLDIGAYLVAARAFQQYRFFCFLNTFSEVVADDWLKKLRDAIDSESVGIVGATASWESLYDSFFFLNKAAWLAGGRVPPNRIFSEQLKSTFAIHSAKWFADSQALPAGAPLSYDCELDGAYDRYWQSLLKSGGYADYEHWPRFPNPHLRSNGFMIRRDNLLQTFSEVAPTKLAALQFESGPLSLTNAVLASSRRVLLIGKNGTYDIDQWPRSNIFRSGMQENLIISDNQTRDFDAESPLGKVAYSLMSWGPKHTILPPEFNDLGCFREQKPLWSEEGQHAKEFSR
jgi:hypothetical protein